MDLYVYIYIHVIFLHNSFALFPGWQATYISDLFIISPYTLKYITINLKQKRNQAFFLWIRNFKEIAYTFASKRPKTQVLKISHTP